MTLSIVSAPATRRLRPCPLVLIPARAEPHADRHLASGELVRVRRGVYVAGDGWRALTAWDRYLVRVYAVLLDRPHTIACLEASAVLQDLPIFGDPVTVHLLDDAAGSARDVGGVRTHTAGNDRRIVEVDGIQVVDALDTAIDLARARHRAVGLAVADATLRRDGALSLEMMVAANESRASSRGRRHARWVTHRATPLAESPLESVSRAAVEWLGFDEPELQHVFRTEGYADRSDMWWEGSRAIGEADGDVKYDASLTPPVEAIRREKERDRRLSRHASGVAHWGWSDVTRVDPLRAELRRVGLRIRHPEDSRELWGFRDLSRRPA